MTDYIWIISEPVFSRLRYLIILYVINIPRTFISNKDSSRSNNFPVSSLPKITV